MVRVLITGAGGGLGRAWKERLERPKTSLEPAFPGPLEVVAASRSELDISETPASIQAIRRIAPDLVLNCAGRTELQYCESAPGEAMKVNRDGAEHVAKACSELGAMAVYFSTDLVFDGGKGMPYVEGDPPNPLNAFAESKLGGEVRTLSYATRYLIVRSGWVYGQPGHHFLKPFEGRLDPRETLRALDRQTGQATWIEDFMEAVIHLLRKGQMGYFHVASGAPVTQMDVLRRVVEVVGRTDLRLEGWGPDLMPRIPEYTALDCGRLRASGWPMRPWEEGVVDFVASCPARKPA